MYHYGDITKINGAEVEAVDLVTFGAPCQDLSIVGQRKGMKHTDHGDDETTRSGLFYEAIRIIKEMRENDRRNGRTDEPLRPRWAIYENVPGALSSNNGEDWRCVIEAMCRIIDPTANVPRPSSDDGWSPSGCIVGDGWSVAWRVHDAQFWGVPQRRKRISLVADFGSESVSEVLFVRNGLQGDSAESNGKGQGASRNLADGVGETISFQDRCGCDGGGNAIGVDGYNQSITGDKAMPLTSAASDAHHVPLVLNGVADCLTADDGTHGFHSQKMRNPEGNIVLGFSENGFSKYTETDGDLTSLRASGGSNGGGTETLILTPLGHL